MLGPIQIIRDTLSVGGGVNLSVTYFLNGPLEGRIEPLVGRVFETPALMLRQKLSLVHNLYTCSKLFKLF